MISLGKDWKSIQTGALTSLGLSFPVSFAYKKTTQTCHLYGPKH